MVGGMKIPVADSYEVRFLGPYRPTVFAWSPSEALAALTSDGTITAVRNCVGRLVAARINGVLLNAREYRARCEGV